MKIMGARWTPKVNMLLIHCSCNSTFEVRADRWNVRCPSCGKDEHLSKLRDGYVKEKKQCAE